MKRIISVLLVFVILCSTFAGLQITSHALSSNGQCGKNVYYTFDSETGLLTISGSGAMDTLYGSFSNETNIKTVIIKSGVTSIGNYAFYDCSSLTSITIPNSVTSIVSYAFYDCSSLTSITIPDSVESIGNYAFSGCRGLTRVNISDISAWCQIFFGSDDANPLYYAHNLYLNNVLITDLVIPNSVTSIGSYAFYGCSNLTSITIPNSVTSIGNEAFYGCTGLTSVTIPNSVTSIGRDAFCGCTGLTSVTIPDSVTSIGSYAFYGCSGLTSVIIPDSVTSIGMKAFNGCTKLKELIIPYSVRFTESVCLGTRIEKIAFNDEPTQITDKFKHIFQLETLKEFEVPDSVNYIGDAAFKDCKNLTSITVPKSVTRIEYNAFSGCTNLTIRGYKDSYAETFCKWAGIPFEVIEEPHTHEYTDVVTLPTCTEQGYTTHTCECGNVVEDTYVDSLGHDYVANVVAPKANTIGYTQYKCSRCSDLKKDEAENIIKDNYTAPTGKPAGFKCTSRTATAEKFTWTKTAGVSGYQIQLLNSAGKSAGTATTTGTAYTFSKLAAGHAYKARVRFYIKAADGKNYYGAWATINSPTLPAGISLVKLTGAKKAFTAQWKKGAVTGYQLQYATNNKFSGAKTVTIKKVVTLKYTISKLAAKKTYYVRVRTYKTMNKVNYYSAWSAAKAVKTK